MCVSPLPVCARALVMLLLGGVANVGDRLVTDAKTTSRGRAVDHQKIRDSGIAAGFNVGQRLRDDQLVIDVDPRNGGDEGFTTLCIEFCLEPSKYPRVITGSGGSHYHLRKPPGLLVLDTLDGFPGVEFKSKKRQVVCAGGIHPDTKRMYVWDDDAPGLSPEFEAEIHTTNEWFCYLFGAEGVVVPSQHSPQHHAFGRAPIQ